MTVLEWVEFVLLLLLSLPFFCARRMLCAVRPASTAPDDIDAALKNKGVAKVLGNLRAITDRRAGRAPEGEGDEKKKEEKEKGEKKEEKKKKKRKSKSPRPRTASMRARAKKKK
mmetsp:Transcript_2824/g.5681  ORF Transcript_2824/g.5681 Transcript_2824/m.5681 type:complete len:114 (-) Transcript_2824:8-349(-)